MKTRLFTFLALLLYVSVNAQTHVLSGRITGPAGKPVPFASIYVRNSTYGTSANAHGVYSLKLNPGSYNVIFRFPGFRDRVEKLTMNADLKRNVQMESDSIASRDFVRRRNITDSAVHIMQMVINRRKQLQHQADAYTCTVYIKGVQTLEKAPKSLMGSNVARALDLDSNGHGILYQSESLSNYAYEKPGKIKELVIASKMAGQNTAFAYNKASDLDVNFYKDVFYVPGLSSRGFVSPVSGKAMFYYNYTLQGAKVENGVLVYKILVSPKHLSQQEFRGYIYIIDGDWRIYSADLFLTKKDNGINLVDTMEVSQQYVPVKDSVWMPLSAQYSFKGKVLGFQFAGYYLSLYNNYNLDPKFPERYFNGEILRMDTVANSRDSAYWGQARPVPLIPEERRYFIKTDSMLSFHKTNAYLDSAQKSKNRFLPLPYSIFGYHAASRDNKDSLYLFPFIQTFYYNTVEGFGVNAKVRISHNFEDLRQWSVTPDLRYGTGNHLLSANIHADYTNNPFTRSKFFVGFGSDVLDLNDEGTRSLYFNTISTILSGQNFVKYYRDQFGEFGYQRELTHSILWKAMLNYSNRTQMYNTSYYSFAGSKKFTPNNPLMPDAAPDDRSELFPQNQALTFTTSFVITPFQQYIVRPSGLVELPSKYPIITVNYRKGIKNIFGSDVDYDFASVQLSQDHIPIGLLGFSAFRITAGNFFNNSQVYFPDYQHFIGNVGTTFNPDIGSFHFLPFYAYSTRGGFLEAHYEHNFSGSLFSNVPFLRKFKLDEIIGGNFLTEKSNRDYSEIYVGVQRFIFRVDYGISFEGNRRYMQGVRLFYGIK